MLDNRLAVHEEEYALEAVRYRTACKQDGTEETRTRMLQLIKSETPIPGTPSPSFMSWLRSIRTVSQGFDDIAGHLCCESYDVSDGSTLKDLLENSDPICVRVKV